MSYIRVPFDKYGPLNSYHPGRSNNTNPGQKNNPYSIHGKHFKQPHWRAPPKTRSKKPTLISLYEGKHVCPITHRIPSVGLQLSDKQTYDADAIAHWYISPQGGLLTPLRAKYTAEDKQKIEGFIAAMNGGRTRTKKSINRKSRKNSKK